MQNDRQDNQKDDQKNDQHSAQPPRAGLTSFLTHELAQPVPEEAGAIAAEIQARHGEAVDAILFYGSCLRTRKMKEAVLDFYVLVRSYREMYQKPLLRWLNALLPPNVFYIEVAHQSDILRAKYAVISSADFEHATTPAVIPAIIWARFCQPARVAYARSAAVQERVVRAAVQATMTFLSRAIPLFASPRFDRPFLLADLWHQGFQATYQTEFRTEQPETIQALYRADPERYDHVARLGLQHLEQQGMYTSREKDGQWMICMPHSQRRLQGLNWTVRATLAKCLYAIRLLKTALTFDDWLPYVLWKLGRHSGVWVQLTERQRRYPLIWGWPVLLRLLRQRALR